MFDELSKISWLATPNADYHPLSYFKRQQPRDYVGATTFSTCIEA